MEDLGVIEPGAVFVLGGEEVFGDGAAGSLVGFFADVFDEGGGGGDLFLGKELFDGVGGEFFGFGDFLVGGDLVFVVGGEGEGHDAIEVDFVGAEVFEDYRGDVSEAQALGDGAFGDAEAGGYLGDGASGLDQVGEGLNLIGRVHGDAGGVFGEGDFFGFVVLGEESAGDGEVVDQGSFIDELLEGFEAKASGDHGVLRFAGGVGDGADD